MNPSVVDFKQVDFSYKDNKVLENFSFSIPGNQWLGMVGVNGSGKSTLLKLILGLLPPSQGEVQVLGEKAGAFNSKNAVGSALQDIDFPSTERVEEILKFVSDQHKEQVSIEELIETFQLSEFRNKACGQLSGGMKRRLALACAFAGKPQLVLLDEPTTGLDQNSRQKLMDTLKKYQNNNQCLIIMISHHPEEVMHFVDGFLHVKNRGVNRLSNENMQQSMALRKIKFNLDQERDLPAAKKITKTGKSIEVVTDSSDQYLQTLVNDQVPFQDLVIEKLSVEELLGEFL